jgi:hypothetical protein
MATQKERSEGIQKGFGGDSQIDYSVALPVGLLFLAVLLFAILLGFRSQKKKK